LKGDADFCTTMEGEIDKDALRNEAEGEIDEDDLSNKAEEDW
jgi:hypothetical protein